MPWRCLRNYLLAPYRTFSRLHAVEVPSLRSVSPYYWDRWHHRPFTNPRWIIGGSAIGWESLNVHFLMQAPPTSWWRKYRRQVLAITWLRLNMKKNPTYAGRYLYMYTGIYFNALNSTTICRGAVKNWSFIVCMQLFYFLLGCHKERPTDLHHIVQSDCNRL